jgi:hypothetical protein
MTLKLAHTFFNIITGVLFMYLLSCDSYKDYSLLNSAKDTIFVKTDYPLDLMLEFNDGICMDSSGYFLINPNQEYVLFKGINNLNKSEIPFTYLLVVSKDIDTLYYFKDKEAIFEFFQKRRVLTIE